MHSGGATITNPFPDFYTILLRPAGGGFGLGIGFFALGRPAVGAHQIRRFGEEQAPIQVGLPIRRGIFGVRALR